jgi:glutamine amidotransferase
MTLQKNVTIVDFGMGNIWSVLNALRYVGSSPTVSSDPSEISKAESLILPGVGSFKLAMEAIRRDGIDQGILEAVSGRGAKILGICLGMQLLGLESSEDGHTEGLGLIPGSVSKFDTEANPDLKVPHIGFNLTYSEVGSRLFAKLPRAADFYFVHAYRIPVDGLDGRVATCQHGEEFAAAYENENIFATQFHPEKSQTNGLTLLQNFLK